MKLNSNKERLEEKAKITLILGPLGSGKTSLIKRLLPYYPKDTILIINDIGAINIDSKRLKGNEVIALKEGCVCCEDLNSLIESVKKLKGKRKNIIIEPSGIAEGTSIKEALDNLGFDISTIFLGDIEHHEKRDEIENQIIKNQIRVADIIGLTWVPNDLKKQEDFYKWLENIRPGIKTINIPYIEENQEYDNEKEKIFSKIASEIISTQKESKKIVFQIIGINQNKGFSMNKNSFHKQAPVSTISKEINISLNTLKNILKNNPNIIRAKGIIESREFDYVYGNLSLGKFNNEKAYITLISTGELDIEINEDILNGEIKENENQEVVNFELYEEKIEELIKQYNYYSKLDNDIKLLEKELSEKKGDEKLGILKKITKIQLEQKILGESMKYDNPYIWLEYKRLAYKGTESKIDTIGDLRKHCESPTYICNKRLMFLNKELKNNGIDIFDENLDENITLIDFMKNGIVKKISKDKELMKIWLNYEYFKVNGRVAKWKNY